MEIEKWLLTEYRNIDRYVGVIREPCVWVGVAGGDASLLKFSLFRT